MVPPVPVPGVKYSSPFLLYTTKINREYDRGMIKAFFFVLAFAIIVVIAYYELPKYLPLPAEQHMVDEAYPFFAGYGWSSEYEANEEGIPGWEATSTEVTGITDLSKYFVPFLQYYDHKLANADWDTDPTLDAGGPGSEIIAYKRNNDHILIGYKTVFRGGNGGPVSCPCDLHFIVFATAPRQ